MRCAPPIAGWSRSITLTAIADGTPTDLIRVTEARMAAINAAYAEIVGKKPAA